MDKNDFPCKATVLFDKNINILFGSGASADYIPTLWLSEHQTYETLLSEVKLDYYKDYIYLDYYERIIKKAFCIKPDVIEENIKFSKTKADYSNFVKELVHLLERKGGNHIRRANIFTTNYDLFFERASDSLQEKMNYILNDGSRGLIKKIINISNFHTSTWQQGTTDNYRYEVPTLNLIKMHGSVSWTKRDEQSIGINYPTTEEIMESPKFNDKLTVSELAHHYDIGDDFCKLIQFSSGDKGYLSDFIEEYKKLAIVSPTKEKFHETVFQQQYYQSLRLLSYELEKQQTVLICFGFSFQDEHIREIIKRSLSNPTLRVFIFCFKKKDHEIISDLLGNPKVTYIFPKKDDDRIHLENLTKIIFKNYDGESLEWKNL